jgi:hypothetical protein
MARGGMNKKGRKGMKKPVMKKPLVKKKPFKKGKKF